MDYEEKLALLSDEDFFTFFGLMKAEPRWVTSAGKHSIQLLGICHHGESHSAVFDPSTLKVTCFSECGGGMLFHTWVKKVLDVDNPQDAKDFVLDWIDGQNINFESRVPRNVSEFHYEERVFEPKETPPLEPIPKETIEKLYAKFDTSYDILNRCLWHTQDGIKPETLQEFQVAVSPNMTIILPHHNINGDIVGLYERSFAPLRKEIKDRYPDIEYKVLVKFPRAKYVPLLKDPEFILSEEDKTSWSFPNTYNLYGFHKAKDEIARTGEAIIFEGGKSVMLAHQAGIKNCVATHTFGANVYHINMLMNAGAKRIYLGFDKQYQTTDEEDRQWLTYENKTRGLAERVKKYVDVYRITDVKDGKLKYKDAPVDQGIDYFKFLFANAQPLVIGGISEKEREKLAEQELREKEIKVATAGVEKKTQEEMDEEWNKHPEIQL